jgi:hypothetical protein
VIDTTNILMQMIMYSKLEYTLQAHGVLAHRAHGTGTDVPSQIEILIYSISLTKARQGQGHVERAW